MTAWTELLVTPLLNLAEVFARFDVTDSDILVVVDNQRRPLGLLTERRTRQALLDGFDIQASIQPFIEPFAEGNLGRKTHTLHPANPSDITVVLNEKGQVDGIANVVDPQVFPPDTMAVLMVGGLGTRLYPLTSNCPKPLLPVHGKPLLEITVERLAAAGIKNISMTVGYRAEMISEHFGDGSKWGVEIDYVHEREQLGTCGALRLLPKRPGAPFIVMNGDVITHLKFGKLLSFHRSVQRKATMCAYRYDVRIPYGVLTADGDRLVHVEEKPTSIRWINAGIYVLDPDLIDYIPSEGPYDMPSLLAQAQSREEQIGLYAMRELWIDIGTIEEYERANLTPGVLDAGDRDVAAGNARGGTGDRDLAAGNTHGPERHQEVKTTP